MFTYIKSEPGLWTVGHHDQSGKWIAESDHNSEEKAAKRVHYLNGGLAPQASQAELPSMTLREWYAGLAMQGIIASRCRDENGETCIVYSQEGEICFNHLKATRTIAKMAFEMADAMLERAKE